MKNIKNTIPRMEPKRVKQVLSFIQKYSINEKTRNSAAAILVSIDEKVTEV